MFGLSPLGSVALGVISASTTNYLSASIGITGSSAGTQENSATDATHRYKQAVAVQASAVNGTSHSNFHVMVSAASVSSQIFNATTGAQTDGGDIRASLNADGSNPLPVDLAFWDKANSKLTLWTTLPRINNSTNTTFYIWWQSRGSALSQPPVTMVLGRNSVWTGEGAVFHFNETSGGSFINATGGGGDIVTNTMANDVSGNLDRSLYVSSGMTGDSISGSSGIDLVNSPAMRFSTRIRSTNSGIYDNTGFGLNGAFAFMMQSDGSGLAGRANAALRVNYFSYAETIIIDSSGPIVDDSNWHYMTGSYNRFLSTDRIKLFVDNATTPNVTANGTGAVFENRLGGTFFAWGYPWQLYNANYDFVIVGPERNGNWYATEYTNLNSPATLIVGGTVTDNAGGATGSVSSTIIVGGSSAANHVNPTGAVANSIGITGAVAAGQGNPSAAVSGAIGITGASAANHVNPTGAVARPITITGASSASHVNPTGAVARPITITGASSASHVNPTGVIANSIGITGASAANHVNPTGVVSNPIGITGAVAANHVNPTGAVTRPIVIVGAVAAGQGNPSAAVSSSIVITGAGAANHVNPTGAVARPIVITGTVAAGQGNSTGSVSTVIGITGAVSANHVNPTGAVTRPIVITGAGVALHTNPSAAVSSSIGITGASAATHVNPTGAVARPIVIVGASAASHVNPTSSVATSITVIGASSANHVNPTGAVSRPIVIVGSAITQTGTPGESQVNGMIVVGGRAVIDYAVERRTPRRIHWSY